jgi:soluble lytic murein transglycosylase-like protein/LysM repeat protein
MIVSDVRTRNLAGVFVLVVTATSFSPAAFAKRLSGQSNPVEASATVPLDEFSPAFLGMYRKVMEIEGDIVRYSRKYGVDPLLARAVCMYESGGNANLTSGAGARGYFQVMPATFRLMRVPTNIEAGIKYLGQLVEQFGREDYALAAYNGGPGRVARGRAMPLESLQYVLGVGDYRSVLKVYEPSVRAHVAELGLVRSREGDDWWALSRRLEVPLIQLRLYNPFLTDQRLNQPTHLIAYPRHPVGDLFDVTEDGRLEYSARIGDNYINLAFAFGVDVDRLRSANELWRLQLLRPDTVLTIPFDSTETLTEHRVRVGEDLVTLAARLRTDPWQLVRDNNLWDQDVRAGMLIRVRPTVPRMRPASSRPTYRIHRVSRGENLTAIARRYGTTIAAVQSANSLGRRTVIRIGQRLRIPTD